MVEGTRPGLTLPQGTPPANPCNKVMRNRFLAGRARASRSDTALDAIAAADECIPAAASRPEARLMMRDVERALLLLPVNERRLTLQSGRSMVGARIRVISDQLPGCFIPVV